MQAWLLARELGRDLPFISVRAGGNGLTSWAHGYGWDGRRHLLANCCDLVRSSSEVYVPVAITLSVVDCQAPQPRDHELSAGSR